MIVKWSSDQVIKWSSSDQVIKWSSSDHVIKWSSSDRQVRDHEIFQIRHRWDGCDIQYDDVITPTKNDFVFFYLSGGVNLGYFPSISWHNQNIGFVHTSRRFFSFFLNCDLKRENFQKKWKNFFLEARKRQAWLFLLHAHRSPWRFLRVLIIFCVRKHVSDVPFLTDELCRP